MNNLESLYKELKNLQKKYSRKKHFYKIPKLWNLKSFENCKNEEIIVNPFDYFIDRVDLIKNKKTELFKNQAYNLFIRYSLSWDHNFKTEYKTFPKRQFNNNGTILKAIALLPYIADLGCSIIHLLPITEIGEGNKKGNLGSPYAIKNHKKIDPNLAEPILETDLKTQYKAFVEAAHLLGIEVVQEFIFRTASIDSDLALENPDWFYWIKGNVKLRKENEISGYGSPDFSKRKLEKIKEKFENNDFNNTIPPDEKYRNYFTYTPVKTARVDNQIIGLLSAVKPSKSNEVKIAPAFADWPPDDNQPPWTDVTYLKLFDNIKFNYIAYNTVRAYDEELATEENKVNSLWEYIQGILPYWIETYNIDGAMVDMGHALPAELLKSIIQKAREVKQNFIFWEENFVPTEKSKEVGYNAVLGYTIFDSHVQNKYKDLIRGITNNKFPINFFLSPENHNTKRAINRIEDKNYSIATFLLNSFLNNINFIHSGFELLEKTPVNSGLGFSDEELKKINSNNLPLFSSSKMSWCDQNIIKEITKINILKNNIGKISELKLIENEELIILKINNKYCIIINLENNTSQIEIDLEEVLYSFGKIETKEKKLYLENISGLLIK